MATKSLLPQTATTGLAAIREHLPDVVLLDVMMPGITGDILCREIRKNPRYDSIYIIMLTAKSMKEAELLNQGADDFMAKPFDPKALMSRISLGLERRALTNFLVVDESTGMIKPSFFTRNLQVEIDRAERYGQNLTLALISLDNFTDKTAKLKPQATQKILLATAPLIDLRSSDSNTRSGSKFAILLPMATTAGAISMVKRMQIRIETHCYQDGLRFTASCSLVSLDHSKRLLTTAEEYLKNCDQGNCIIVNGNLHASSKAVQS